MKTNDEIFKKESPKVFFGMVAVWAIVSFLMFALIGCAPGSDDSSGGSATGTIVTGTETTEAGGVDTGGGTATVETKNSELPSVFNLNGNKNIAIKSKVSVSFSRIGSEVEENNNCEIGALDSGDFVSLIDDDSICPKAFENYGEKGAYFVFTKDQVQSSSLKSVTGDSVVYENVTYHVFVDTDKKLHYINNIPTKGVGKTNDPVIKKLSDSEIAFLSSGDLIKKDLTDDSETVLDSGVDRFDINDTTNGKEIITFGTKTKVRKVSGEIVEVEKIAGKKGVVVDSHIMHEHIDSGGSVMQSGVNLSFIDDDGNVSDPVSSVRLAFAEALKTGDPTPNPEPVGIGGVQVGEYYIYGGKVYLVATAERDLSWLSLVKHGHSSVASHADVRACANGDDLYFYSYSEFLGHQFTYINIKKDEFRHIDTKHKFTSVQCLQNGNVVAIGKNIDTGVIESITFENPNQADFTKTVVTGVDELAESY